MMENPWKFRKSSDIEMEVLFRRAENVWNEAIAANNAEWKQEYGKLVEQSRKELADKDAEWVEWLEKTFEITKVCTDCVIGTKSCISRWCTYRNWQERKRSMEAK